MPFGVISTKTIKRMERVKKPKRSKRLSYVVRAGVNSAVKSAIARTDEVKRYVSTTTNFISNAGANIANVYTLGYGTFPLSPYTSYVGLATGNTDSTRVGNRVKTKRAYLDLMIRPNVYDVTNNPTPCPCIFVMWIYRLKNDNSSSGPSNAINSNFKDSNASVVGLAGTDADLILKDNTNVLQVLLRKEYKIGFSQNTGTGSVAASAYQSNNDFQLFKHIRMDITKYLYSQYDFNDATQIPYKQAPTWLTMEMIPYNNDVASVGARPGKMSIAIRYDFTDA